MIGSSLGGGARIGIVAVVAVATLWVHGSMDTSSAATSGRMRAPDPERTRALALGFEPLIADYYWIQAIQIVGDLERMESDLETVGGLIDLVTELDPWVDHPYRFAALWMTEDLEQVEHANRLLERGIAYHPLEWRNRFYLGYNQFFYHQDNLSAADTLEGAVPLDGAPDYLGAFVTRLRASSDGLHMAALFLEQLIRDTDDEYARAEYLKAFDEIETERRARHLDRARVEFWDRNGRDIREPAELWSGSGRVLGRMPPPHPHFDGFAWKIDPESDEIVSTFYGSRYRVHVHPEDAKRRKHWRDEMRVSRPDEGVSS